MKKNDDDKVSASVQDDDKKNIITDEKALYASFTTRLIASILDTVIISLALLPLLYLISQFLISNADKQLFITFISSKEPLSESEIAVFQAIFSRIIIDYIIQLALFSVVVIVFWNYKSATPGKMLLGFKIVDANTLEDITGEQSLKRFFSYFISMAPLCLGFFWVHFDKKRQAWHDKIAGTVVIKKKYLEKILDVKK